jgi:hypothetical protein
MCGVMIAEQSYDQEWKDKNVLSHESMAEQSNNHNKREGTENVPIGGRWRLTIQALKQ